MNQRATEQTGGELTPYEEKELLKHDVKFERGIIPQSITDVVRFANMVHQSGLAPKGFDTPQKVAIGIMMNMELGRPIILGLQDLAVINGRCAIYGDAVVAQVLASGRGDCNEHTVLFVAMARALGLPARTAVGLVFALL